MNKIILITFLLILFTSFVSADDVVHCWNPSGGSNNPSHVWDGCRVPLPAGSNIINDNPYDSVVLPGAKLTISNFGSYNFHCDNGANESRDAFYVLDFDESEMYKTIPSLTNGPGTSKSTGYARCEGSPVRQGSDLGYGPNSSISYTFTDIEQWTGGHYYNAYLSRPVVAGTYGTLNSKYREDFFFVPSPSLLLFGEADSKYKYYEDEGTYGTTVFFTVVNKFPLKIRLKYLDLICPTGLTCSEIDSVYTAGDWLVGENDGILIIPIDVNFPKSDIGAEYSLQMDANFDVPALEADPQCNTIYPTHSIPFSLNTRLIDMQNIQIELIAAAEQSQCIGLDGVVGQTGSGFAPKVNIGFGGTAEANNLISIDECDVKTINGEDNTDGVYCSQKEFLVEMGRKIAKIYDATKNQDDDTIREYGSGIQIYMRTQDLSQDTVQATIDEMTAFADFNPANTGLQPSNSAGGFNTSTKSDQIERLSSLFESVTFKNNENKLDTSTLFPKGIYTANISLVRISPDTQSTLFSSVDNSFNPNYKVEIEFANPLSPSTNGIDWFFYDYANYEIDDSIITIDTDATTYTTNVLERGTAFKFTHEPGDPDLSNNILYQTYATPFYIRVSDVNAKKITLTPPNGQDTFSYWTGFASNKGAGCDNIFDGEYDSDTVPYYKADAHPNNTDPRYSLTDADIFLQDGIMYLETILYSPTYTSPDLEISTPFNIYTENDVCDGNKDVPCQLTISESTNTTLHKATNLGEVFSKIESGEMCVHFGQVGANTEWNIFWNEQAILQDLSAQKATITDANMCALREILDTP